MADEPARDLERVLDLLWARAEDGNVVAQKALYEHYRREGESEEPVADDWSDIYGEQNVTPIRRAS